MQFDSHRPLQYFRKIPVDSAALTHQPSLNLRSNGWGFARILRPSPWRRKMPEALKTHFRRERFARECLLDLNGRRAANIQDWLRETPNKPSIKTCRLFLARLPLWSSVERTPTRLAANRPDHAPLLVLAVRIARRRGVGVSFHRSQQHLQLRSATAGELPNP
jgi:hypothetical protein